MRRLVWPPANCGCGRRGEAKRSGDRECRVSIQACNDLKNMNMGNFTRAIIYDRATHFNELVIITLLLLYLEPDHNF